MHVTKLCEALPEHGEGWGTQPLTDLSWLLDAGVGGCERGAVARMTIEPGGGQASHRHPGSEEATLVLDGRGTALAGGRRLPIEAGNLLYAPAGADHALSAGAEGLDLLVVLAEGSRVAGWEEGGEPAPEARAGAHLLSGLETGELELEEVCFAPGGGAHELHRHPDADEFFVVLAGEGVQLDEDGGEVAVEAGDLAFLPRGSWHGFRNTGKRDVRAVLGLLGASGLDAARYELPQLARAES